MPYLKTIYEKKCEIYDSLDSSNNINKILNTGETYLNNPIFILDTSYHIIARSILGDSITSSIENHNGEYYLLIDTVNIMKKDKCIDNIYNSSTAFFHFSDKNLIFCAIRINKITISYICVLQEYREFMEDDLELTNTLSKTISIQIQRDNLFITSSGLEEEYYLMHLLSNPTDTIIYTKQRLKNIDFKLNKNMILISIPFPQKYKDYRHNFGLRELITSSKNILGNCISTYYEDKIIFLVSEKDDAISINIEEKFKNYLKLNNLKAGVSFTFQNLLQIKEYYAQSIYALQFAQRLNDDGYMFYFKNFLEYYMFSLCEDVSDHINTIKLHTLVHPLIKELMELDKHNNTELLKTLMVYLSNNRNSNIASRKLNIHRSTFFYRFHKIEKLLNISLSSSDILFEFELSLKILKYENFT